MKHLLTACLLASAIACPAQDLKLNDLDYFERQGTFQARAR